MKLTNTHKISIAAIMMGTSILTSRVIGLIRDKLISWEFGTSIEADIYFTAFVIPDFINYLLAGGYISITLIPLLAESFDKSSSDGWKFFSTVFLWATSAIIILTGIAWFFAYDLAQIAAPGFTEIAQNRLGFFLRIILPAQIFFLSGACLTSLLYIRKQFLAPALMPLIYNGCIILFGMISPHHNMEGFCWGVLVGAAIGAFLLPLWVALKGGLQIPLSLHHPLMKRFLLLALPLMIGQSIVVLDEQLIRIFGSFAEEGTISLLNYARRITLVPVGIVAQAISVASYPFLASLAAKNDLLNFDRTLHSALKSGLMIVLPITGWMIACALPALGLIFEGGNFTYSHTVKGTPSLQIMLLSIPFWVVHQIIGRSFYAKKNTITPAILGTFSTILFIPFFPFAVKTWGGEGIAIITTISIALYTILLSYTWKVQFGIQAFVNLGKTISKTCMIVLPCSVLSWWSIQINPEWLPSQAPFFNYLFLLALSGLTFISLYSILFKLFFPTMTKQLFTYVTSKKR